ncbi:MAG: hypothetical protein F6K47_38610 [Symploca sp. SIO2E6]|nr:hypothetical protein [Symploca sp. SIO2E6]
MTLHPKEHWEVPQETARIAHASLNKLLDIMLLRFSEKKLIKNRGKQRTDSTQMIAAVRQVNRLELVGETLRAALNEIALLAPEWLTQRISEDWCKRYRWRIDNYRLPKTTKEREQMAHQIGLDRHYLLNAVWESNDEGLELSNLLKSSPIILQILWLNSKNCWYFAANN